jgi:hypothetical protein
MAQSQFAAISASQGAGPAHAVALYTHTDMYQRAATLGDIQARQLASSLSLHKAVQDTLRASVPTTIKPMLWEMEFRPPVQFAQACASLH